MITIILQNRRHGEIKEFHVCGDPRLCMLYLTCTSSPRHHRDGELLYGQGESTSPTGRLSGEGTHLASARQQESNSVEQKGLESQKQNVQVRACELTIHLGVLTVITETLVTTSTHRRILDQPPLLPQPLLLLLKILQEPTIQPRHKLD